MTYGTCRSVTSVTSVTKPESVTDVTDVTLPSMPCYNGKVSCARKACQKRERTLNIDEISRPRSDNLSMEDILWAVVAQKINEISLKGDFPKLYAEVMKCQKLMRRDAFI